MNSLIFNYPESSNQVRIFENENGESLFCTKDVCKILAISNHNSAIKILDEDQRGVVIIDPPKKQKLGVVTESGLYQLIFKSTKPEAKKFRKWVTSEVLPQLRKTGRFELPQHQHNRPQLYISRPTQCFSALKTINSFGYKCIKDAEESYNADEQMHIFHRFINVIFHEIEKIDKITTEYFKHREMQPSNPNSNFPPDLQFALSQLTPEAGAALMRYLNNDAPF